MLAQLALIAVFPFCQLTLQLSPILLFQSVRNMQYATCTFNWVLSLCILNTSAYLFHQTCKVDHWKEWLKCKACVEKLLATSLLIRLAVYISMPRSQPWPVVFCRCWTQLVRLHRTHYYTKDSVGSCFHLESTVLTDMRRSRGISHKSACLLLLIWKHGWANPITVMNRIHGFRKDYFVW